MKGKTEQSRQLNELTVVSNLFWRFAERFLAQIITVIVSIALARLLTPEAYGTVALLMVVITIFQVFVDSGLGNALIQKKDSDDLDFSTVFYTNIVFCTLLFVLIILIAPFIAGFYDDVSLVPYIRVLGLTILFSGVKNVQQSYVSKKMMFKKFFLATLSGTVISGVVGIIMAYNNFGVWALVAQHVINLGIDTLVLWITVKWRPVKSFSFERLKALFSYGWKLLVSALIDTGYTRLRQLIIGKVYSPADLAFYDHGDKYPSLVITCVDASIDSVLLPTLSSAQNDKERVKSMTRRSIQVSTYIMAPLLVGIIFTAEPLVRLLLTDKWLPAVPFLRIFCIVYLFYPIHTANLNAVKALGRSDLFLKLEIIKKSIGLLTILITVGISVKAMAYSLLVTTFVNQIVNNWPNRKLLNYNYFEQLKDVFPNLLLSFFMGVCVFIVSFIGLNDLLTLIIQIVLGILIYLGFSYILKMKSYTYSVDVLRKYVKRNNE